MNKFRLVLFPLMLIGATFAYSQRTVSGIVISSDDKLGIPGASVIVKGSYPLIGTASDFDGHYSLSVPEGATLVFSSTGMQSKEVEIGTQTSINVTLSSIATDLDAVVVIGYGSQKKKEVTGSVASVKQEDFNAGIKTSPMGLLQGKVAGLTIQRTEGGDPTNTGFNIQIRGFSTLDKGAGTSPLYIVDGIPVNNIDNIAPDDIASMDVLKDGSAAAIYGTRGTNGVIIITTKRGGDAKDALQVAYSGYVSVSTRVKRTGMASPEQFRDLESISNGKFKPTLEPIGGWLGDGKTYNVDWVSEMSRKAAITHNHNLSISGVTKNSSYRGSIAYKNAQGIAKNSNRSEIIAKLAADQTALDGWLNIQYDFSYMHYRNDFFCGDYNMALIVNPTYPIYDSTTINGYYYMRGSGQSNPVEAMNQKEAYQDGNYFRGSIRPTINIKAVPGLKLTAFAAFEEGFNANYWFNDVMLTDAFLNDMSRANRAGRKGDRNMNRLYEVTVDYANDFGNHSIAAVAGLSYQHFEYDGYNLENAGFATSLFKYYKIENGYDEKEDDVNPFVKIGSYRNSNTLVAMFARVNYSYNEKYLLSASIRREGSSRFGKNNKWGWFPAVSAGWRMKNEAFLKNNNAVNDMKLRFGFGITGNNLAADLRSIASYVTGGTFWYNGSWVSTLSPQRNINPDLRWEKKFEYNFGYDFAVMKNRFYGSLDLYLRETKDLLWEYNVPVPQYQYPILLANAGKMRSMGAELSLNYVAVKTNDFQWTTTLMTAYNNCKVLKLSDPSKGFEYDAQQSGEISGNSMNSFKTQYLLEGHSIGAWYGYKYAGTDANGKDYYEKADGTTGYINSMTDNDKKILGTAQPFFTFGWNNQLKYKNWDLEFFFRGVVGGKILNVARFAYSPAPTNTSNIFMKDVETDQTIVKSDLTSQFLEDASYIKLDNITLGYNIPVKANKYISNARIYFTAQNIFTATRYSGIDPEVNTISVWHAGIDYANFYPNVRNFMFGVNITMK
ncbi:MAG: SusC/RagA family TonB-linked outer membrane protein [Bacteroidales bacterium]|nr:SusC/RagA family TonB-linked outer membrane protein [Bacteroidales bacterium]